MKTSGLTPSGKAVIYMIVVVAIVIPILLTYVLVYPPNFSPVGAAPSSSTSSSSSSSSNTIILPAGIGATQTLNFEPDTLTVAAGTTIVFVNKDTSIHNIYFTSTPSGATIPSNPSPNTPQWTNGEYTVTLTVPGTYTYICQYHSWMKGTIVVTG